MAFPVTPPALTPKQSIDAVSEAEAGISQCMADFLCNEILTSIATLTDINQQVALSRGILKAYACKEQGIADVVKALSSKIYADKGIVPDCDGSDTCSCDC